ncbi:MAG: DUF1453 family protein [Candidatus Micrarchaeota archaeon]|nr:DUF1453 family protein [Candidatus Micrarchaeota archaeon]
MVSGIEAAAVLLVIVVFIVFRMSLRVMRNRRGAKYSLRSILLMPVVYMVLTALLLVGLAPLWMGIVGVAIVLGILAGLQLGRSSELFEKDGKVLYRRSTAVMAIWIVGFVARIVIEFALPLLNGSAPSTIFSFAASSYQQNPILLAADMILGFSAGLLMGETIVLYNNHKASYGGKVPKKS